MSSIVHRTLIVEDDLPLARALLLSLKKISQESIHLSSKKAAWGWISEQKDLPELILVDRGLPDGDGLEICRKLRKRQYPGIILMLTARGEVNDRVEGLDAGADDYLSKPFAFTELSARVRAIQRRRSGAQTEGIEPLLQTDPAESPLWSCDPERLRVLGPRGWRELTTLEFKLAAYLIEREGRIVHRDELLREVWGFSFLPRTRTVDHFMGRLRRILEPAPDEPIHFQTVRGAGYRFCTYNTLTTHS